MFHSPDNVGLWDINHFIFDGKHHSTGYDKDYNFDNRLQTQSPINVTIPQLIFNKEERVVAISNDEGENFNPIIQNLDNQYGVQKTRGYYLECNVDNRVLLIEDYQNMYSIYTISEDSLEFQYRFDDLRYFLKDLTLRDNNRIYASIIKRDQNAWVEPEESIIEYNLANNTLTYKSFWDEYTPVVGHNISNTDEGVIAFLDDLEYPSLRIAYRINSWEYHSNVEVLNGLDLGDFDKYSSNISIQFDSGDSLFVLLNTLSDEDFQSKLYLNRGSIEGITPSEEEIISSKFSVKSYPNPFNPASNDRSSNSTIEFSANEEIKSAEIKIYNIKGQLVRLFSLDECNCCEKSGSYSVSWDGCDAQGVTVASGVYNYTVEINDDTTLAKKMIIVK